MLNNLISRHFRPEYITCGIHGEKGESNAGQYTISFYHQVKVGSEKAEGGYGYGNTYNAIFEDEIDYTFDVTDFIENLIENKSILDLFRNIATDGASTIPVDRHYSITNWLLNHQELIINLHIADDVLDYFKEVKSDLNYFDLIKNDIYPFKKNGKYGIKSATNTILLEADYESLIFCSDCFFARLVNKDLQGGIYIQGNNQVFIPCEYKEILYKEGWVGKNGKWGKILNNSSTTDFIFDYAGIKVNQTPFFIVQLESKKGLIDELNGELIIPCKYDSVDLYYYEPYIYCKKYIFILDEISVEIVYKAEVESDLYKIRYFDSIPSKIANENYYNVKFDKKWGIFNQRFNQVLGFDYDEPIRFEDGLFRFLRDGIISLYSKDVINKEVFYKNEATVSRHEMIIDLLISYQLSEIRETSLFKEKKFYSAQKHGKWGIIDSELKTIVECSYDLPLKSVNTAFEACSFGKWGLYSKNFEAILPCWYDAPPVEINEECFLVKRSGNYGLVDRENRILLPLIYERIWKTSTASRYLNTYASNIFDVYDTQKKYIIGLRSEKEIIFFRGYYLTMKYGKLGLVDKRGFVRLAHSYNSIEYLTIDRLKFLFYASKGELIDLYSGEIRGIIHKDLSTFKILQYEIEEYKRMFIKDKLRPVKYRIKGLFASKNGQDGIISASNYNFIPVNNILEIEDLLFKNLLWGFDYQISK